MEAFDIKDWTHIPMPVARKYNETVHKASEMEPGEASKAETEDKV